MPESRKLSRCKYCGASILFAQLSGQIGGGWVTLDPARRQEGQAILCEDGVSATPVEPGADIPPELQEAATTSIAQLVSDGRLCGLRSLTPSLIVTAAAGLSIVNASGRLGERRPFQRRLAPSRLAGPASKRRDVTAHRRFLNG